MFPKQIICSVCGIISLCPAVLGKRSLVKVKVVFRDRWSPKVSQLTQKGEVLSTETGTLPIERCPETGGLLI